MIDRDSRILFATRLSLAADLKPSGASHLLQIVGDSLGDELQGCFPPQGRRLGPVLAPW